MLLSTVVLIDFGGGGRLEEFQNIARRNFFPETNLETSYYFLTERRTLVIYKRKMPRQVISKVMGHFLIFSLRQLFEFRH